jgi:hypothetical protein
VPEGATAGLAAVIVGTVAWGSAGIFVKEISLAALPLTFYGLWLVAGQHRHRPRPGAADFHDHAARPLSAAAGLAKVGADKPRPGAEADQRGGAHPPGGGGLGVS